MDINKLTLPTTMFDELVSKPRTPRLLGDGVTLRPDWSLIYPLVEHTCEDPTDDSDYDDDCDGCFQPMTPALAYLLDSGLELAADVVMEGFSTGHHGELTEDWLFEDILPASVLRWLDMLPETDAARWAAQFVGVASQMRARLASGQIPSPRCTAEEMMYHLAIGEADVWQDMVAIGDLEDPDLATFDTDLSKLSDQLRDLGDWLLQDEDVLMLFDPRLDGFGEDGEAVGAFVGAVYMHPRDWFTPFNEDCGVIQFGRVRTPFACRRSIDDGDDATQLAQEWLDVKLGSGVAAASEASMDFVVLPDGVSEMWQVDVMGLHGNVRVLITATSHADLWLVTAQSEFSSTVGGRHLSERDDLLAVLPSN